MGNSKNLNSKENFSEKDIFLKFSVDKGVKIKDN
jgi:hypothetical protein